MPVELWYFFAYLIGTLFGIWVGFKLNAEQVIIVTIDNLVENGFLRTRENAEGEIEILKINEE